MSSWQHTYPDQEQQQVEDDQSFIFPGGSPAFRIDPSNNEVDTSPFPIRAPEETRTSAAEFQIFSSEPHHPQTGDVFADYQYRASSSAIHSMAGINTRSGHEYGRYSSPPNQFGSDVGPSQQAPQGSFFAQQNPLYTHSPLSSPLPSPFPPGTPYGSTGSFNSFGTTAHASPPTLMAPTNPYGLTDPSMMASGDSTAGSSPYASSDSLSPSVGSTPMSPHSAARRRGARDSDSDSGVTWVPPASRKRPRRRADEIDRIYVCGYQGCGKGYGTLNHLNAHVKIAGHGPKRRPEEFREVRAAWKRRKEQDAAQAHQQELSQSGSHRADAPSAHRHHTSRGIDHRSAGLPYPSQSIPQPMPQGMTPSADGARGMHLSMPRQAGPGPSMSYDTVARRDPTHQRSVGPSSPLDRPGGSSRASSSHELSPTAQMPTWPAGRTDILSPPGLGLHHPYAPTQMDPQYYSQPIRVPGPPGGFSPSPGSAQFSPQYHSPASSNTSHDPVRDPYHTHNHPPR